MNFKIGDRVRLYDGTKIAEGVIFSIQEEKYLLVRSDDKVYAVHYKQCRKLVKKKIELCEHLISKKHDCRHCKYNAIISELEKRIDELESKSRLLIERHSVLNEKFDVFIDHYLKRYCYTLDAIACCARG